jgi:thioredoxin reductase
MHGYLSRDGLPPTELIATGRAEVASYGGVFVDGAVESVTAESGTAESGTAESGTAESRTRLDESFDIAMVDGSHVRARRLIVATGLRDVLPDIPGLRDRWARDVLHCPYCHGYEVRDQAIGVLGDTLDAVAHAQLIRQWSADVVLFANGLELTVDQRESLAARDIAVVDGPVIRIVVNDDRLSGVEVAPDRVIDRSVVFVRPRFVPNNDVLVGLGCATDPAGWVVADGTGRTTVPGVWVAGNVANPRAQVITAAGEGSAAAIAVNADLVEEDVRVALKLIGRSR